MIKTYFSLLGLLFMVGCASQPPAHADYGYVDIFTQDKILYERSGRTNVMIAEVIRVEDVRTKSIVYEFDSQEREGIAKKLVSLPKSKYQIAAMCIEKTALSRISDFVEVRQHGETWVAGYLQPSGNTGFIPIIMLEVDVEGGERITAVNMWLESFSSCHVLYGDNKVNRRPENIYSKRQFIKETGNLVTLH